jgi:hypothetical protein
MTPDPFRFSTLAVQTLAVELRAQSVGVVSAAIALLALQLSESLIVLVSPVQALSFVVASESLGAVAGVI